MPKNIFVAMVLGACAALPAQAQTWPAKAVRVVVPFPPGGAADTLIRPLTVKLADALGQQFVADARPGAGLVFHDELLTRQLRGLFRVHAAFDVHRPAWFVGRDGGHRPGRREGRGLRKYGCRQA